MKVEKYIDQQFAEGEKRLEILSFLKNTFQSKTRDEWVEEFEGEDICFSPIHGLGEVFSGTHAIARKMICEIEHPICGPIKQIPFPIKFSGMNPDKMKPPSQLGQDTEDTLFSLGFSKKKILELRSNGVI